MDYRDFAVRMLHAGSGSYRTEVLASPAGDATAPLSLGSPPPELAMLLEGEPPIQHDLAQVHRAIQGSDPKRLGSWLFHALFGKDIKALYDASRGIARAQGYGLRLKLHFDPQAKETAALASLPWELLYADDRRTYLALDAASPIVRYLQVPQPPPSLAIEAPLRIAILVGLPGTRWLDGDREIEELRKAWRLTRAAEVSELRETTVESLRGEIRDGGFHVLHYLGHAYADPETEQGGLELRSRRRSLNAVDGGLLAQLLAGIETLRLVVLNACETGHRVGVGPRLVEAGLPAVVGMQLPISDDGAIAFSRGLYPRLARGEPLDGAVTEARLSLCAARRPWIEWATPVLFLRSADGQLFRLPDARQFELGMGHFRRGEHRLAAEQLRHARSLNPLHGEADLFYCLARLSEQPPGSLAVAEADEIDGILRRLVDDHDETTESLARLALGLLRHDFYRRKRLVPRGATSDGIFRQLAGRRPTEQEKKALQSIRFSHDAALACNLPWRDR